MRRSTRRGRGTDARRHAIHRIEPLEPRRLLSANVLTWHDDLSAAGHDLSRQGLNSTESLLTPSSVNQSTFGKLFSYPVQGQIYAQPLYVSNLAIGGGTHDVVFVATEHDMVYALDADSNSGPNGGVLWSRSLGTPAPTPNPYFGFRYNGDQYTDITPEVGITSTPLIDPSTGTMYVDAFSEPMPGTFSHTVYALDITSGADKVTPAIVSVSYPGTSTAGGDGTTITFDPKQQLQRPALTLLNGTLYVAYGSYADTDPYHGWLLGFDPATLRLQSVFNTTPNETDPPGPNPGEGAIWQTGGGLASDGDYLYFSVGNGDFDPSIQDYGDSFLKMYAPGFGNLQFTDYFTPSNQDYLAANDLDLGSGGVMLLPDSAGSAAHPQLMVGCGKQGTIYLVDRNNLGQYNSTDHAVQELSLGEGTWSSPAYFNGNIYYHGPGDVLKAFSINNAAMSLVAHGSAVADWPGSTPTVSSNASANGIVWEIDNSAATAVLHAYTPSLSELYNSGQNAARDGLGTYVKFTTPAIADGKVFVGTANALAIFGLLSKPIVPPAAPSNLTAAAIGATSIVLHWTDNSNNETGFKIERSADGMNFSQIAIAPANSTSFTDTGLAAGTKYYYRVRATNSAGDSAYTAIASATTAAAASVLGGYVFYNHSIFGDQAIDTSKQPLLAGGLAGFSNLTGYSKGLNGIMVDVANPPAALKAVDFLFDVGSGAAGGSWSTAPANPSVAAHPGAGVSGSMRVEIVFPDNTIRNEWLRITVQANADTGLAQPAVLMFGNLVGFSDAAPGSGQFVVTAADETAARKDLHGFTNPAGVTNPHDYNKDGKVDAVDELIARYSANSALAAFESPGSAPTPFLGHPFNIATDTIEAENFDLGGEGISYHDTDPQNAGGQYRDTGVDIAAGGSNGYHVGNVAAGEWLDYTISVPTTGTYTLNATVAAFHNGGNFHAEIAGVNVTGTISVPDTGAWTTWQTISSGPFTLTAGTHVMRVVMDTGGYWGPQAVGNFDYFRFAAASQLSPALSFAAQQPVAPSLQPLLIKSRRSLDFAGLVDLARHYR